MRALQIDDPGPLTLVQDGGRSGLGALGVGRSGWADRSAAAAADRLVGNPSGTAGLEITAGPVEVRAVGRLIVAVTGAHAPVTVLRRGHRPRPVGSHCRIVLEDRDVLRIGPAVAGLRCYLAVRGGLLTGGELGSRATDLHAGLGPAPRRRGDVLAVGAPAGALPAVDAVPPPYRGPGPTELAVLPGPRADWFTPEARTALVRARWTATADLDRVGVRLTGRAPLARAVTDELPSEGVVTGAVQVPADGYPVIFLADHPVTGGYPVIAVLTVTAQSLAAQLRPGEPVRFVWSRD